MTSTSTEPAFWNPEKAAVFGLGVIFIAVIGCFTVIYGWVNGPKILHQIWTDVDVLRNDDFGSILAFNLVSGTNTVVEVSHSSGVRPENSTCHAQFDTLLIALPGKSCLTAGAKYEFASTDNHIQYSEFTGRYAVCIDTNAMAKAVVTVLSATENSAKLQIECSIPCLMYDPLHPMDDEAGSFERDIDIKARFGIVDTRMKKNTITPIVAYISQKPKK